VNLESLRAAFLQRAEEDAARRRAEVEAECERRLAAARERARSLVEQAKLEGQTAGEEEGVRRRRLAERAAREKRLAARGEIYEALRSRAREDAFALRAEPGYGALLDRLADVARRQLGPAAAIEVDPAAGGILAHSGARSVDYTLPALVDRALVELDGEVEQLWR
jgi:vacuolar-type H+-ATPase subunit E/Vma4